LKKAKNAKATKLAIEYIEMTMKDVVKQKEFLEISEKNLVDLVKRDGLNIKEIDLFNATIEWSKAELKRTKQDDKPENVKKVMKDIFPQIRFCCMDVSDIAVGVEKTKLLEGNQLLGLFTYLGQKAQSKDSTPKLDPSLKGFKTTPRKPKKLGVDLDFGSATYWTWNKEEAKAVCTGQGSYYALYNTKPFEKKTGKHEIKMRLNSGTTSSFWCGFTTNTSSTNSPYSSGWGFWIYSNYLSLPGNSTGSYLSSSTPKATDVVNIELDTDTNVITWNVNGGQPVTHTSIYGDTFYFSLCGAYAEDVSFISD